MRKPQFSFTLDGKTYTRSSKTHTYTHAIVFYQNWTGFKNKRQPCEPYVSEVSWASNYDLAYKCSRRWPELFCKTVIVSLSDGVSYTTETA